MHPLSYLEKEIGGVVTLEEGMYPPLWDPADDSNNGQTTNGQNANGQTTNGHTASLTGVMSPSLSDGQNGEPGGDKEEGGTASLTAHPHTVKSPLPCDEHGGREGGFAASGRTLIVIDGSWSQAKIMFKLTKSIQRMPRAQFNTGMMCVCIYI